MNSATHAAIGATAVSLFFPKIELMAIGALAAQIPDIDSTESAIGAMIWPIANFLESRFSHRGLTHSLIFCSGISIGVWLICQYYFNVEIAYAFVIGLFSSVIGDCFTKQGVQLFWPIRTWCVVGLNPQKRMRSGSPVEYWIILICGLILAFSIKSQGIKGLSLTLPGNQVDLFTKYPEHCFNAAIKAKHNITQEIVEGNNFLATSLNTFWRPGQFIDNEYSILKSKLTVKNYCEIQVVDLEFNDEPATKLLEYAGKYVFVFGKVATDETISNNGNFQGTPIGEAINIINNAWITGTLKLKIYGKLEYL
jgi:membrane-bound metal-dependent hydrolase YbcI (DUF457 family)